MLWALPSIRTVTADAAEDAEKGEQQFALALAVEAAQPDDSRPCRTLKEMSLRRSVAS
jgi:hypothetical protein